MASVKIKKVEIKIDKKTINLSLEQAKELKAALDDLFQKNNYYPYFPYYPVYSDRQWTYTTSGTEQLIARCTVTA